MNSSSVSGEGDGVRTASRRFDLRVGHLVMRVKERALVACARQQADAQAAMAAMGGAGGTKPFMVVALMKLGEFAFKPNGCESASLASAPASHA